MYEVYAELRDRRGLRDSDVSKATGVARSTFTDWKSGRSSPKGDKLQKIADYFGVSPEYLRTGKKEGDYYLNDDARKLAQFLFESPEHRVLFDASRTVKKEDIAFVLEMIERLNR